MLLDDTKGCTGTAFSICQHCARYGKPAPHITTPVTADGDFCEERRFVHVATLRPTRLGGVPLASQASGRSFINAGDAR